MTFYGYEEPVSLAPMNVYNTDMMKTMIAAAKDMYDESKQDYEDFMKLYQDFYSDVPGDTDAYYQQTIGGARDLINKFYANGIDPFKNPEARAAIARYIASVPVGELNQKKRAAEAAKEFKKNRDKLIAAGLYDPAQERYENAIAAGLDPNDPKNLKTLEEWDSSLGPWTQTQLSPKFDPLSAISPYAEKFRAQEYLGQSRPGYALYGTTEQGKDSATDAAMRGLEGTLGYGYMMHNANQLAKDQVHEDGTPVTGEEILRNQFRGYVDQILRPKEEDDKLAQGKILDSYRTANDNWLDQQKQARDYQYWKKKQKYDPNSPLYEGDKNNFTSKSTGKMYDDWFSMINDEIYIKTKGSSLSFLNGQFKKLIEIQKNQNGDIEITDDTSQKMIDAMSHDVPGYTLQELTKRTPNKDGSIYINIQDVSRIYHKDQIARAMYGSKIPYNDNEAGKKTKKIRKELNDVIGKQTSGMSDSDVRKSAAMVDNNKFVYYINRQGEVRVFMPISVSVDRKTGWSKGTYDDLMYDTGIRGVIDANGNFVSTNETYLTTFNYDMTHHFANKSMYSTPTQ